MNKIITGRPPRTKDIERARELKQQGLSIRQISWAILKRDDPKTIHRWVGKIVGKSYPQGTKNK